MPARRYPTCNVPCLPTSAREVANGIRFDRFYARRKADRLARGDPSPEDLGAQEARRQIAEVNALEQLMAKPFEDLTQPRTVPKKCGNG